MASDFNHGSLQGRLATDVVIKEGASGRYIVFSLAFNTGKKTPTGWTDEVNYLNDVAVFSDRAVALAPKLRKGMGVILEYELRQKTWTDGEGKKRSELATKINDIFPLFPGRESEG